MQELCDEDFGALAGEFRKIAAITDPIDRLRRIGQAYVGFAMSHRNHYRLMFMTPHPESMRPEDSRLTRGNPEEDAYAFLKATVAEAIAAGRLRPELTDADLVSQMVWAGTHGVVSLHIAKCKDAWVDWRDPVETAHAQIEALIRGLAREEQTDVVDLATKSLLHDKLRFLITVSGVAFAVTLVFVQVGLFLGLLDNASITIEHIDADLWVTSRNTPNVDFAHTFPDTAVKRVRSVPGVERADNLIVWFVTINLPSGAQEGSLVYALEDFSRWNIPWNVEQGDLADLKRGQYFFLDDSAVKRYGPFEVGEYREILGQRMKIIGRTQGRALLHDDADLVRRLRPGPDAQPPVAPGQDDVRSRQARARRRRGGGQGRDRAAPALQRRLHEEGVGGALPQLLGPVDRHRPEHVPDGLPRLPRRHRRRRADALHLDDGAPEGVRHRQGDRRRQPRHLPDPRQAGLDRGRRRLRARRAHVLRACGRRSRRST